MLLGQRASYNRSSRQIRDVCLFSPSSCLSSVTAPSDGLSELVALSETVGGDNGCFLEWVCEREDREEAGDSVRAEPELAWSRASTQGPHSLHGGWVGQRGWRQSGKGSSDFSQCASVNIMGIVQSSFLTPTFFSDFIYWLNYINHTLFQKKRKRKRWGEAWSEESSSLLNMCPGNNLLFSFPGSVFSLQTIKQEHISSPRQSLHPQQIALHGERGSSQFTFPNAL